MIAKHAHLLKGSEPGRGGTKSVYELIAAGTLAILALACFASQALSYGAKTTQRETVLFNTLQFLLTFGFAWFSTRAVSRGEFEQSLKRFAIGAYRRISDIEAMVVRLEDKIAIMRASRPPGDRSDLDVVTAIVEDTRQVVHSSIADWADVIGAELIALHTIKGLEREKSVIQSSASSTLLEGTLESAVAKIDKRIEALTAALPANLAYDAQREEEAAYTRQFSADWMADRHNEEQGLRLRIVTGGEYTCDRDPKLLAAGEVLSVFAEANGVNVRDRSGTALGRALNNSPLKYDEFRDALADCFGRDAIEAKFERVYSERDSKGVHLLWYDVIVTSKPIVRPRARRKAPKSG